ncbi:hypothetical protein CIPAW_16G108900 [Carya illinoinensis]|uniref:Signal recognition particle receptor alpha subunit N-terminal domain-containing protein n=1 Tax=Carya illinoinensis TaxID=32201 RepID=A0A8T1N2X6_CARIL|nr:hypothetical protein CIPAW_16G108900 [Carya illinoinensis]
MMPRVLLAHSNGPSITSLALYLLLYISGYPPSVVCANLLAMVKPEFLEMYDLKRTAYSDFDETFRQLKMEAEARAEDLKRLKQVVGKPLNNSKKQGQMQNG